MCECGCIQTVVQFESSMVVLEGRYTSPQPVCINTHVLNICSIHSHDRRLLFVLFPFAARCVPFLVVYIFRWLWIVCSCLCLFVSAFDCALWSDKGFAFVMPSSCQVALWYAYFSLWFRFSCLIQFGCIHTFIHSFSY